MAKRQLLVQKPSGIIGVTRHRGPIVTARLTQARPPGGMVRLNTGEYVTSVEFGKLNPAGQSYLRKFGIDAFNKEQARVAGQRVEALAPYKVGEGYDVTKMVAAGYSADRLRGLGFAEDAIKKAQKQSAALVQVQAYKRKDGYDLQGILEAEKEGKVSSATIEMLFDDVAIGEARETAAALVRVQAYKVKDGYDLLGILEAEKEGKVSSATIELLFDDDVVGEARETAAALAPYKSNGGFDIAKMLQDGYTRVKLVGLGFSGGEIDRVKEAQVEAQEVEGRISTLIPQLQQQGCGVRGENGEWQYDLTTAVEKGFDKGDLTLAFGEEAVTEAATRAKAIKKLGDDSPAWALLHNKITKEEIELIYGEDAAKWVADKERFDEARQTLSQLGIKDIGDKIVAALIHGQYVLTAGATEMAQKVAWATLAAGSLVESIPSEPLQQVVKVPLGLTVGAAASLAGSAYMLTWVTGLPLNVTTRNYTKNFVDGTKQAFMAIPAMVAADPVFGASMIAGFVLGPVGVYKLARGVAVRASPYYVPNTALRFSFTTGKVSLTSKQIAAAIKTGKITEVQVANAVARVMSKAMRRSDGIARVTIGRSKVSIFVEPTPGTKWMGSALWHSSPLSESYKGLKHIVGSKGKEPASFYSLHAAPRFAMMSAKGIPATKPCLVMLYTKAGKLRAYPTSVQYAQSLSSMKVKGFQYLGSGRAKPGAYGPIKTYANQFELEAMLPNGMKIYRVTNLRSRILGAGAGEFVTAVDGWILPIYRFIEKGASIPKIGIAELAAIRVESVIQGIKVLLRQKGFGVEKGYARVGLLTKQFERIGRAAIGGLKGSAARVAYNKAVNGAMVREINRVYAESNPASLERAWRANPDRYEGAYLTYSSQLQARASGYKVERATVRRDTSYTTYQTRVSEPLIRYRAREFDRTVSMDRGYTPYVREERPPERLDRIPPERLDRIPPERLDRIPPSKTKRLLQIAVSGRKKVKEYPPGTVVWKMGLFWKIIPPPYSMLKPISSKVAPKGVGVARGTPQQTLTFLKGKLPFKNVSFDLGVVDGFIDVKKKTIVFTGKGTETDVGKRIVSTTKGVSLADFRVRRVPKRNTVLRRKVLKARKLTPAISVVR